MWEWEVWVMETLVCCVHQVTRLLHAALDCKRSLINDKHTEILDCIPCAMVISLALGKLSPYNCHSAQQTKWLAAAPYDFCTPRWHPGTARQTDGRTDATKHLPGLRSIIINDRSLTIVGAQFVHVLMWQLKAKKFMVISLFSKAGIMIFMRQKSLMVA